MSLTGLVSGGRRLSFDAFAADAARAAAALAAQGLGIGDSVALLMRNDIVFLLATAGAQQAGCYPVPINWHGKGDEVRFVLEDCGARLLIAHADLLKGVVSVLPPGLMVVVVETPPEIAAAYRVAKSACRPDAHHVEWDDWLTAHGSSPPPQPGPVRDSIIYTSGTSGRPKGVRRATADPATAQRVEAMRRGIYGFRAGMRTVLVAPMYHSAPNSYALRAVRQAELVLLLPRFDAEELLQVIAEQRITHLFMVPTMFIRLLNLPAETRARYDLSSLEWIIHAGSPCPPAVKQAMIAWLGRVIHEFYGGTESGCVTYCDSADSLRHPGTVGRGIDGSVIEIHRDDGTLASVGEPGEIFMRVTYVPDFTYVGRADLRAEIERNGLITCGDIGFLDADGFLFICDRKRDMVIVGGVNVYPAEIEGVLIGMPGVRDCAVFGIPHPEYGEGLMAVVQPEEGGALRVDAIRAFLATRLADYKVPRTIEMRTELPREESGKIFKRRLRDPYWVGLSRTI